MLISKEDLFRAQPLKVASANSHLYMLDKEGGKFVIKCSLKPDEETRLMYEAENSRLSSEAYDEKLHPRYPKHYGYFESINIGDNEYSCAIAMEMLNSKPITLKDSRTRTMKEASLLLGTAAYTINYTNSIGYYHMDIESRNCLIDAQNPYQLWIVDYTGAMCEDYSTVSISYPFMSKYPIFHQHVQLRALLKSLIDNPEGEEALEKVEEYISGYKSRPSELTNFVGFLECLGFKR